MEKEKYYTPEIEDFHVGYECEINFHANPIEVNGYTLWTKYIITSDLIKGESNNGYYIMGYTGELIYTNKMSHFRVPYLTVEQIEAEGWIKVNDNTFVITSMKSDKFDSNVEYSLTFNRPRLTPYINIDGADADSSCYRGMCKSINELRTIMKLLRIN